MKRVRLRPPLPGRAIGKGLPWPGYVNLTKPYGRSGKTVKSDISFPNGSRGSIYPSLHDF